MRFLEMRKPFTTEEIRQIFEFKKRGYKTSEIAEIVGRTTAAINTFFAREKNHHCYSRMLKEDQSIQAEKVDIKVNGVKVAEAPAAVMETQAEITPRPIGQPNKEMTPREMIKRLYDLGYRIENNQLVCYQRVQVKIQDIINS